MLNKLQKILGDRMKTEIEVNFSPETPIQEVISTVTKISETLDGSLCKYWQKNGDSGVIFNFDRVRQGSLIVSVNFPSHIMEDET